MDAGYGTFILVTCLYSYQLCHIEIQAVMYSTCVFKCSCGNKLFLPGENQELKQTIENYDMASQNKDTQVQFY